MNVRSWLVLGVCAFAFTASGCVVRKSTYEGVVDQLADARAEHAEQVRTLAADRDRQRRELVSERELVEAELEATRQQLSRAQSRVASLRDQVQAEAQARDRLAILSRDAGAEAERLRQRVQALSSIEAEIRSRNRIYEDMIERFRSMIDAGQLSVSIVRGRMVLLLPQDILFPSGSATLSAEGTSTLGEIGGVLATIPDRRFQVEGHTDNVPIATARFASNWELSTARALSVVRLLVQRGVPPASLSGAGFGEFQPVADNGTSDGRRANRRIEIVMLPNLDVISQTAVP